MVCNIPIKIIRWLEGCYQSLLLLNDSSCCPRSSSWPAPSSCAGLRTRCWPWWQCLGSVSPSVPSSLSCPTSWPSRLCCGTPSSSSFTIPWSVHSIIIHIPMVSQSQFNTPRSEKKRESFCTKILSMRRRMRRPDNTQTTNKRIPPYE